MKLSSAVFGLFTLSTAALAAPAVGDYTNWTLEYQLEGQSYTGSSSYELASFDEATQKYVKRYTTDLAGSKNVDNVDAAANDVLTKEYLESLVTNCASLEGGVPEMLSYPGGELNTCKVPLNDETSKGHMWIAAVPDGVAKIDTILSRNNARYLLTLKDFAWKE